MRTNILNFTIASRHGGTICQAAREEPAPIPGVVGSHQIWMSEFEIDIRATMDSEESRKTSDRLKEQRQRASRRGAPMPGGRRPFGFERDGVTINEAEADLIREAVARLLE